MDPKYLTLWSKLLFLGLDLDKHILGNLFFAALYTNFLVKHKLIIFGVANTIVLVNQTNFAQNS